MKKYLKPFLIVAVLIAAIFAIRASGLLELLGDFNKFQDFIRGFGVAGYFIFILIYILIAVFSLPALVPTIAAGIVFGPVKGALLALLGATIGAVAAFLVSRYVARDFIVRKFGENPIFKKVEAGVEKNGKDFLILTRLVPIFPYNIQNYAYGVTSLKLSTYALVSLITMAPGAFIYAYLAGDIAENGITIQLFLKLIVAGVVLFGVSQIPKMLAKKKGIEM